MAPPLIQLKDIRLTFGGTPLLSGVELSVSSGERVCLIGRNGSGKSTLLKIAAGLVEPDGGSRFVQPGATIRYLPQEPDFGDHKTTLAYVEAGLGPGDDHYQARYLVEQLGLSGDEDPAHVSGGEARRAALARWRPRPTYCCWTSRPTISTSRPSNGWKANWKAAALRAGHHQPRPPLPLQSSRSTAWLDRGQIRQIDRGFSAFEAWRDEVLAEEERDQHKLDRKIVNEEHWLRYGVSGRRKRNVKRLGNLLRCATSGAIIAARPNANLPPSRQPASSSSRPRTSQGLWRSHDRRWLFNPRPARRPDRHRRPERRRQDHADHLLIGNDPPDSGTIRLGANIEMATLDQHRESLDPKSTLAEA